MANLSLDNFFNTKESSVSDLDWLEVDMSTYENLPFDNTPEYIAVPKLEQAWNYEEQRSNFNLVPNVDMDFNYKGVDNTKLDNQKLSDVAKLVGFLKLQMMTGKKGSELKQILVERSHPETLKLAFNDLKKLSNELGLLGNVYVDPNLFSKCEDGAEFVRKRAKTSKYVLSMDKCSGCAFNKEGRCEVYKKHLAKEIEYGDETLGFYSKHFSNIEGKEVKIASRQELQNKFSKEEVKKEKIAEFKPSVLAEKDEEEDLKEKEEKFKKQLEDFQNSLKNTINDKISHEVGFLLNKGYSSEIINKHILNKYSKKEISENQKSISNIMAKQGSLGKVYIDTRYIPIDICKSKDAKEYFNKHHITAKYILSNCNKSNCSCKSISSKKVVSNISEIPSYVWENEFNRYSESIKVKLSSTFEENKEKGLRLASIQTNLESKKLNSESVKETFKLSSSLDVSELESNLKKENHFNSKKVSTALDKGFSLSKIIKTAKSLGISSDTIQKEISEAFKTQISSIKKHQLDVKFNIPDSVKIITSARDVANDLDNFNINDVNFTSASMDAPFDNSIYDLDLKEANLDSSISYNKYEDLNVSDLDEFNI